MRLDQNEAASEAQRAIETLVASRRVVFAFLGVAFVAATIYNTFQPIFESTAVIAIREVSKDPLVRLPVDPARTAELIRQHMIALRDPDLVAHVVAGLGPSGFQELSAGSLSTLSDQARAEWRRRVGGEIKPSDSQAVDILESRISVIWREPSTWIEVHGVARDPKIAAAIANLLIKQYVVENRQRNIEANEETTRSVEAQVEARQDQLGNQLDGVRSVGQQTGGGDLDTRKYTLQQQGRAFLDAMVQAQAVRAARMATVNALKKGDGRSSSDPQFAAGANRIADLEDKLSALEVTLGDQHPEVVVVQRQLELARQRQRDAQSAALTMAETQLEAAVGEEGRLNAKINAIRNELAELETKSLDFSVTKQKAVATRAALDSLIYRKENAASTIIQVESVQEAAVPNAPRSPQKFQNYVFALTAGLVLSVVLIWLRDSVNSSVRTPEDVQGIPGLRFLGAVQKRTDLRGGQLTPALVQSADPFADGVRMVRTGIVYSNPSHGRPPRVIVVTSGSPGEGKSTLATSMATLLTETNASVLLIDADLRRPACHSLFKMEPDPGLSEFLSGSIGPEGLIRSTGVERLDIITAGAPRLNSSALLGSPAMDSLIKRARVSHDWVIVDSPPTLVLPDASVLATLSDGVLLVCKAETTKRRDLRATADHLIAVGGALLGVVLNQVDMRRHYYYYGRSYASYYGAATTSGKKAKDKIGENVVAPSESLNPIPAGTEMAHPCDRGQSLL